MARIPWAMPANLVFEHLDKDGYGFDMQMRQQIVSVFNTPSHILLFPGAHPDKETLI